MQALGKYLAKVARDKTKHKHNANNDMTGDGGESGESKPSQSNDEKTREEESLTIATALARSYRREVINFHAVAPELTDPNADPNPNGRRMTPTQWVTDCLSSMLSPFCRAHTSSSPVGPSSLAQEF